MSHSPLLSRFELLVSPAVSFLSYRAALTSVRLINRGFRKVSVSMYSMRTPKGQVGGPVRVGARGKVRESLSDRRSGESRPVAFYHRQWTSVHRDVNCTHCRTDFPGCTMSETRCIIIFHRAAAGNTRVSTS